MSKMYELKKMIASRAGKGFYKSYVKNVKMVKCRAIKNHACGWCEQDYTFDYKGKHYRVNEHIVPNSEGDVSGSAKFRYELKEI